MGQVMQCLKKVSRQLMFAGLFLELGEFTFQAADLGPTVHHQVYQGTDQEITLCPESLHLAFIRYPLVAQYLKNLSDLLKHLPG